MVTRICWNCEKDAHLTAHGDVVHYATDDAALRGLQGAYICDNCRALSIARAEVEAISMQAPAGSPISYGHHLESSPGLEWLPIHASGEAFPDVPAEIAEAANEAHRCASIGARRAAIMLARAVIEATAKDRGITKGVLQRKIEQMFEGQIIREHIRDAAHGIRDIGNEMAHGDPSRPAVTDLDVALTLDLMGEILNEVFQSPAKIKQYAALIEVRTLRAST